MGFSKKLQGTPSVSWFGHRRFVPASTSARNRSARRIVCVLTPVRQPKDINREVAKHTASERSVEELKDNGVFSATKNLAGAFSSMFFREKSSEQASAEELLKETARRAAQVNEDQNKEPQAKPVADIRPYLKATGIAETRYMRMLASLCSQTYYLSKLTPRTLYLRHRLNLVTTSLACEKYTYEPQKSAVQTMCDGDAMAADPQQVTDVRKQLLVGKKTPSPALQAVTKVDTKLKKAQTPADVVTASLSAAASAAAGAAVPLANNISSFALRAPISSVASTLQNAAAAGHSTAIATMTTVAAAMDSSWNRNDKKVAIKSQSPTEWFVCDDTSDMTRYFVIQGSDNLDHWKVNLSFDPVIFEDAALGVKVHRGVYEAAQMLYDRFLPMVEEHLASSPFAKVAFTGHSLGGSLGTLLMLMYLHRGVLPPMSISPVYTFGSPAIFCEGSACSMCSCSDCFDRGAAARGKNHQQSLLSKLGLNDFMIKNVIMHRDIVPRAFACDYTLVADLLKRVGDSFKGHGCLQGSGKVVLYFFIGRTLVLQPDENLSFVGGEGYLPILPSSSGLWMLREPTMLSKFAVQGRELRNSQFRSSEQTRDSAEASTSGATDDRKYGSVAPTLKDAVMELMDNPHPLDILGDPGAYGTDGSISRYHNPDHYTMALGAVIRTRSKSWRKLLPGYCGPLPSSTPLTAGLDRLADRMRAGTAMQ